MYGQSITNGYNQYNGLTILDTSDHIILSIANIETRSNMDVKSHFTAWTLFSLLREEILNAHLKVFQVSISN